MARQVKHERSENDVSLDADLRRANSNFTENLERALFVRFATI